MAGLKEDQWPGESDFDDDRYLPMGALTGCMARCHQWPCGDGTKQASLELKEAERKVKLKAFRGAIALPAIQAGTEADKCLAKTCDTLRRG